MGQPPFARLLTQLQAEVPPCDSEDWLRIARQQQNPSAKLKLLTELANAGFNAQQFHQRAITHLVTALRRENDKLRTRMDLHPLKDAPIGDGR